MFERWTEFDERLVKTVSDGRPFTKRKRRAKQSFNAEWMQDERFVQNYDGIIPKLQLNKKTDKTLCFVLFNLRD